MVISQQHQYLFIEVPQTASSAIRAELRAHYDGQPLLHKHATWREFANQASAAELDYRVIGAVRHPLDILVSMYEKWRTDHHQLESDPAADPWQLKRYRWVRDHDADFASTVRKFFKPWDVKMAPGQLAGRGADFQIRFEQLDDDFADMIRWLGLEPVRTLPVINRTDRPRSFRQYYSGIEARCAAAFGPWSEYWGYDVDFLGRGVPGWARSLFRAKMTLKQR